MFIILYLAPVLSTNSLPPGLVSQLHKAMELDQMKWIIVHLSYFCYPEESEDGFISNKQSLISLIVPGWPSQEEMTLDMGGQKYFTLNANL